MPSASSQLPIEMAFSWTSSGAEPATGSSLIFTSSLSASAPSRVTIRELSTHEPMCHTGGRGPASPAAPPRAVSTALSPSPAYFSVASGLIMPACARMCAVQPVVTIKTLLASSSLAMISVISLVRIFGFGHPANATAP